MSTDKFGRPLAGYPTDSDLGRLLGINRYGTGVYATDELVSLAVLDERGELRSPPRQFWATHELPLDSLDLSRDQYVLYLVENHGPWRAVSDTVTATLEAEGIDRDDVVRTPSPDDHRIEAIIDELNGTEEWTERSKLASELRLLVLDSPGHARALPDLVALLDDVDGEADPTGAEGEKTADPDYDRIATRQVLAYVVARIARRDPDVGSGVFERIVRIAGDDTYHDPQTSYKEHLVDVVDVGGRDDPESRSATLTSLLKADSPTTRERTLNALYHLERRYVTAQHPLLEDEALRARITAAEDDPVEAVSSAALDITMLHDFESN